MFVNDIVHIQIVKAFHPEQYLALIRGKEIFAILPKQEAINTYKIGQNVFAAVKEIIGARVILTQRTPHFISTMLKTVYKSFFEQTGWNILKCVVCPPFVKVLVDSNASFEQMNKLFLAEKRKINFFLFDKLKIYFIPRRENKEEQIKEAFKPCPIEKLLYLEFFGDEVIVYVEDAFVPLFVGAKGINLKATAKLCMVQISVKGIQNS